MKALGILILALGSSLAWAKPYDMSGIWQSSGEYVPSHSIVVEIVPVRSDKDRTYLNNLKAEGFNCLYVRSQTYRCTRLSMDKWPVTEEHALILEERNKSRVFDMVPTGADPKLITEGTDIRQWELPLIVYMGDEKTASVVYWENKSGIDKMDFTLGVENFWPHFSEEGEMRFLEDVRETSEKRTAHYYYDVIYRRR
ncbi:MAG TPA: hypothetical protein DCL41_05105 [Bdellovibrionales bacterium]|nr:hypothetical protein [Pseudobdellovibrionaceae bacterium]HAG91225.1 hypothetical protein [Bdellovibrionales bacterium]